MASRQEHQRRQQQLKVSFLLLATVSFLALCCPCSQAFSLGSFDLSLRLRRSFPSLFVLPRNREQGCRSELEELRRWRDSLPWVPATGLGANGDIRTQGRRLLEEGDPLPGGRGGKGDQSLDLDAQWSPDKKVERDFPSMSPEDMRKVLGEQKEDLERVHAEVEELKSELGKLTHIKSMQDYNITNIRPDFTEALLTPQLMDEARTLIKKCSETGMVQSKPSPTWKGYMCSADDDTISKYLAYPDRGPCPDDWPATQNMIFVDNCFALPKRRCLNPTSSSWKEPLPFPQSLFDQDALIDENVRWTQHGCKSYDCLNNRLIGDCRNCFDMKLEKRRWRRAYRGSIPMKEVIALKNGSLRIGLDAGGGSGSFAAHMALHGVTVMTTAMNIETIKGRYLGLPYMETIALRGLIPLHVPHKSRLPFFDNTLDIIHCVNSVKYLPMLEFEELLFEWDRILRVGGVMWFEMFYAPMDEMPIYVALIEQLGYKKLHWNMMPKPDYGERKGIHVYLNCIIEKPVRKEPSGWFA